MLRSGFRLVAAATRLMPLAIAGVLALSALPARSDDEGRTMKVVTEDFPPFQFVEEGKLVGPAVDVMKALLADAGIRADITVLPWARAMKVAETEPDVLIFSIGRTSVREPRFKWIGAVTKQQKSFMYGLRTRNLPVADIEQARQRMVGTAIDDVFSGYLARHGFEIGKNMVVFREYDAGYAMLKAGRVDMLPLGEVTMAYYARKHGDRPEQILVPLFEITDRDEKFPGDFVAASPGTPDAIVERLKASLNKIKTDGTFAAIQAKWMP